MCVSGSPSIDVISSKNGPSRAKTNKQNPGLQPVGKLCVGCWGWAGLWLRPHCGAAASSSCVTHPPWPWPLEDTEERKGPLPGWPASGRFQPVLLREHPKGRLVLKREAEAVQLRPGWPGIPDEMFSRTPAGLRAWMCSNRCPFHCSPCLASPAPIFRGHKIGKYGELESTWKSPGPSQHFLECHSVPGPENTTTVHNHNQY